MRIFRSVFAALLALALVASGNAHARFVSVDPVQPDTNTGENFNRYHYANNNPYRFVDPDGRQSRELNFDAARSGYTPPPRSPDDWLGPAIGHALTGVVAAPVMGFGASAILARPAAASAFNVGVDIALGDALGGGALASGGAIMFRVVGGGEMAKLVEDHGRFSLREGGMESKQFVGNIPDAQALQTEFIRQFGAPQHIVRAFAPQHVIDATHTGWISDAGGMNAITVPGNMVPEVICRGSINEC